MAIKKVAKKEVPASNVNLPVPQSDPELSASAARMLVKAQRLQVTTAEEYESAAAALKSLTEREKEIEAKKAEMWNPLAKLTKAVQSLFNPPLKVLDQAKKIVSGKMGVYALEQRNIALAAQARADQEAEDTRQALLAKAEKATDNRNYERAEVLEARANSVQAETVEVDIPKVHGIQLRERWLFEITNEADVPNEYRSVDEAKIRAAVARFQDKLDIPGVRIWSTLKPQG